MKYTFSKLLIVFITCFLCVNAHGEQKEQAPDQQFIELFTGIMEFRKISVSEDQKAALRQVYPLLQEASKDEFLATHFFRLVNSKALAREISWDEAKKLIQNGKVRSTMQFHSLTVILTTWAGESYKTKEPSIDEVIKVVRAIDPTGVFVTLGTE